MLGTWFKLAVVVRFYFHFSANVHPGPSLKQINFYLFIELLSIAMTAGCKSRLLEFDMCLLNVLHTLDALASTFKVLG